MSERACWLGKTTPGVTVDTCIFPPQSLVIPEKFQHILRVLNTNIDGRRKIAFAITAIKVSRDAHLCLRVVSDGVVDDAELCVWCLRAGGWQAIRPRCPEEGRHRPQQESWRTH